MKYFVCGCEQSYRCPRCSLIFRTSQENSWFLQMVCGVICTVEFLLFICVWQICCSYWLESQLKTAKGDKCNFSVVWDVMFTVMLCSMTTETVYMWACRCGKERHWSFPNALSSIVQNATCSLQLSCCHANLSWCWVLSGFFSFTIFQKKLQLPSSLGAQVHLLDVWACHSHVKTCFSFVPEFLMSCILPAVVLVLLLFHPSHLPLFLPAQPLQNSLAS